MTTTADKLNILNIVVWAFSLFSALILLLIALSWYRKKRFSLFNKAERPLKNSLRVIARRLCAAAISLIIDDLRDGFISCAMTIDVIVVDDRGLSGAQGIVPIYENIRAEGAAI